MDLLDEFGPLKLHGNSKIFLDVLRLIKKLAKYDTTVLIEGETGTGKENAARALHYLGARQDNAFIPINCGSIPDSLFESELFGYEKGAFTDAKQKQAGLVALAHKGTLFLDEVDSLSPRAQASMLRFLQTGEYRPLGGGTIQKSQVRVIAATNADLSKLVEAKQFREDLYYRLNVFRIRMPALRDRRSDIRVICEHFVQQYVGQYGSGPTKLHPKLLRYFESHNWPGNIRELENTLLREFLLSSSEYVSLCSMPDNSEDDQAADFDTEPFASNVVLSFQKAKAVAIRNFENRYLEQLLAVTEGNVSEAARLAGKERRSIGKLIKKYKIDKSRFCNSSASH